MSREKAEARAKDENTVMVTGGFVSVGDADGIPRSGAKRGGKGEIWKK